MENDEALGAARACWKADMVIARGVGEEVEEGSLVEA
jgi:hypothetical protein